MGESGLKVRAALVAAATLLASSCDPGDPKLMKNYPEFASAQGVATMARDGVITVRFPAFITVDTQEAAFDTVRPDEGRYDRILKMIGDLKPGQVKPFYVPDEPPNSN
jgi:hypothetical protein